MQSLPRIEMDTDRDVVVAGVLRRMPDVDETTRSVWDVLVIDRVGEHHRGRFDRFEELVAWMRAINAMGAAADAAIC